MLRSPDGFPCRFTTIRACRRGSFLSSLGQPAAQQPVQYKLSFPEPEHHYAQVEVTWPGVTTPMLEARMSRSSPGRYAVHEFSKNVFDVHAFDGHGKELIPARPNPYQWNVTGHDGTVRLTYKVFGNHVDGTYLAVDESHAHMNMPATLMWARGFDMRPVARHVRASRAVCVEARDATVSNRRPLDVHRAEPAVPDGQPDRAERLHAALVYRDESRRKEFTIRTAVHHDGDPPVIDGYAAGAEKIVNEAAAVFGEFPAFDTGTYTFLGDYVPWGGGDGMEHRNSTVVASPPRSRSSGRTAALGTRVTRVLPLLERRADPAEDRSSHSTSKTQIFPASCGWPKASRSTTVR